MKVSTIIPIYNSSKFLGKCLDSLLESQVDYLDNEIILVNDGSSDNSLEICDQYAGLHKNISVFSQENQGPSVARNLGIEKAAGEYITFVDSDDFVEKDYFKQIICAVKLYPNTEIITFGYYKVDNISRTEKFAVNTFDRLLNKKDIRLLLQDTIDYNYLLFPFNKLYKKSLVVNSGLFPTNLRLGEDTIFNLKLFYNASSAVFMQKSIYNYFYNLESITSQKYKPDLIKQMEDHFSEKLKFYRSNIDLNKEIYFKDIARVNLEKTFYAFLANLLANPNLNFVKGLKQIREVNLIRFGFEHCKISDVNGKKKRLILFLFKNRFYTILKLLYLKSL